MESKNTDPPAGGLYFLLHSAKSIAQVAPGIAPTSTVCTSTTKSQLELVRQRTDNCRLPHTLHLEYDRRAIC